ncbi:SagB/ThcOx family dehydrogenase [Kribbella sp. NPDC026596]|uniref:SagB/ThcOx family dehydrogenase n=1 Tax=Kribbella sp. NPDC026596 TaxID=3155122 RepID=UPI0033D2AC47
MPTFRKAQPLAWTYHRGSARVLLETPQTTSAQHGPGREDPTAPWIPLPPGVPIDAPLTDLIRERVSCRAFRDRPLGLAELATLLRTGYGVTGVTDGGPVHIIDRAPPSAGGLYPLEVSVLVRSVDGLPAGIYHYVPFADGLEQVRDAAVPPALVSRLFLGQPWAAEAAVVLVLSAVCERSLTRYADRGYRYLLLEAGHVAQTLVLAATGLNLGAVTLGGFLDDELSKLLALDTESEIVLYGAAVGHPVTGSRLARRALDRL